mgnify:FL=1
MMKDIPNRIRLTQREDGYIISTVKSYDKCYGAYETAIMLKGLDYWNIVEGYETEEEAIKGHAKYEAMTEEEINKIEWIG